MSTKMKTLQTLPGVSNIDDKLEMCSNLGLLDKSKDKNMTIDIKEICIQAAVSHYVTIYFVLLELVKLQILFVYIACMELPGEVSDCDENSSRSEDEDENMVCSEDAHCDVEASSMDLDYTSFDADNSDCPKNVDLMSDDPNFGERNSVGFIRKLLSKANTTIPIYSTSLSKGTNDLKLYIFIFSPINFIHGIHFENLLSIIAGFPSDNVLQQYYNELYKMNQTASLEEYKCDSVTIANRTANKGNTNKSASRSKVNAYSSFKCGATSPFSFMKLILTVLLYFAMVRFATGSPVLGVGKMVDKAVTVEHQFPLLISNWCQNPEKSIETCINTKFRRELKIVNCNYKCSTGEKVWCMDSKLGMVFFCIPEVTSCEKGIGWHVTDIVHRGIQSYVIVEEGPCPNGYYQSTPSKCYNACKSKHEPLHLIPKGFKIAAEGDNIQTTLLRCDHDNGLYNAENKSYISFDENFDNDFCTRIDVTNPCRSGQMPLYNGTCVNNCNPGFERDDKDFLCKLNGTIKPTGKMSTTKTPTTTGSEVEAGKIKDQRKDGRSGVQGQTEAADLSRSSEESPWKTIAIIFGSVLPLFVIAVVMLVTKLYFPHKFLFYSYRQVPGSVTGSEVSSDDTVTDVEKDKDSLAVKYTTSSSDLAETETKKCTTVDEKEMKPGTDDVEEEKGSPTDDYSTSVSDPDETDPKKQMIAFTADDDSDQDLAKDDESSTDGDLDDGTYGKSTSATKVKNKKEYKQCLILNIDKVEMINMNQDVKREITQQIDVGEVMAQDEGRVMTNGGVTTPTCIND